MRIINKRTLRFISYGLSACFLIIHIVLLVIFWTCKVQPMVIMNCVSVLLYLGSGFLIHRNAFRLYLDMLFVEVLVHMALAIYFTGWDNGFPIPLLNMYIIAFTGEYLVRAVALPRPRALAFSIVAMIEYITLFIHSSFNSPAYPLPASVSFGLQIMWAVMIFMIGSSCLYFFLHVATRSELILLNEAERDKLTGVYNRAGYDKIFAGMNLPSTTLLLIDGDQFKSINDTYGHETGDQILKKISNLLTHTFRSEDYVCRLGGDEFAVLMKTTPELTELTIYLKIARINNDLAYPKDDLPPVSISVGVCFGRDCENAKDLFSNADKVLYQVKAAGGNDCAFYH